MLFSIANPCGSFMFISHKQTMINNRPSDFLKSIQVSIFLNVNGYSFKFPADVIDFMLLIAKGRIRSVRRISKWIKKSCTKNSLYGLDEERMVSISEVVNLPIGNGREVPMHLKKV